MLDLQSNEQVNQQESVNSMVSMLDHSLCQLQGIDPSFISNV